jgi:transcriptional regulator with PAS, ATPase and Fis domain
LTDPDAGPSELDRIALVGEIVAAVPRPGGRPAFYEKLLDTLFRTLDVKRGLLALRGEDGAVVAVASRNAEPGAAGDEVAVSRSVLTRTLEDGLSQRLEDAMADPTIGLRQSVQFLRIRSVLCVPVVVRGKPEGVLYADNRLREDSFCDDDLAFLELLGRLAGIALEEGAELITASPAMEPVLEQARRAALSDAGVLVVGESGVGKEVLARAIHGLSARRDGPFVAVNCAAIPETLLEAELFGLAPRSGVAGAPAEGRAGKFERADRGTILLDEIGDMALRTQARILRVLETHRVERLGGDGPAPVDIRVIAATNKDLDAEVAAGRFRDDLYFRLRVVEIRVPPLRDRTEDVLPLAEYFLQRFGGDRVVLSRAARHTLLAHAWPGNVRELRNAVERALVVCDGRSVLLQHLPESVRDTALEVAPLLTLAEVENAHIRHVLAAVDGNVTAAAKRLGVARSTLYEKLKKLGLAGS